MNAEESGGEPALRLRWAGERWGRTNLRSDPKARGVKGLLITSFDGQQLMESRRRERGVARRGEKEIPGRSELV